MAASLGLRSRVDVDVDAEQLDINGAWRNLRRLQPAGRAAWSRQSRVGELGHADGAAQAGERDDSVSRDVLGRVAELAASRLSRVVSDGRDLSWPASGRSSTSA